MLGRSVGGSGVTSAPSSGVARVSSLGEHGVRVHEVRQDLGMCGKPKFCSASVFKNRTAQKLDIRSDGFPIETAYNPPFK